MRKKIESKEVNAVNLNSKTEEKKMDTIESVYAKMSRRISYLKDRDTTSKLLDFQDALQTVMVDIWGKQIVNPKHYIRRAVSFTMKDSKREISLENFGDSIETKYSEDENGILKEEKYIAPAMICNAQGEIVEVLQAINSLLSPVEKEVFDLYTQGFTCKDIEIKLSFANEKRVQRMIKRIYDKIDTLKISYFYNSKYVTFQGRQGKDSGPKYDSTKVYNPKTNSYDDSIEVKPSVAVNRSFLCLDQSKEAKTYNFDKEVKRFANRREAYIEIASDTDRNKYEVVLRNIQYSDSTLPNFETNKEVQNLYHNKVEYARMIKAESTTVGESRYKIEFSNGKYISGDHKYLDF